MLEGFPTKTRFKDTIRCGGANHFTQANHGDDDGGGDGGDGGNSPSSSSSSSSSVPVASALFGDDGGHETDE